MSKANAAEWPPIAAIPALALFALLAIGTFASFIFTPDVPEMRRRQLEAELTGDAATAAIWSLRAEMASDAHAD